MLCICELLGQQNRMKIEKYFNQSSELSPMGYYLRLIKKLIENESPRNEFQGLKMRSQLINADFHDMVQFSEIPVEDPKFTILNYVNNQRSGTRLSEYLKHNYQSPFN